MGDDQPGTRSATRIRAHSVAVTEKPPFAVSPDYADAFEVARRATDRRSSERWARDGFERLPVVVRRSGLLIHRRVLGFRLGPWVSPDHIFGWRIAKSEPELLHLEARSPLLRGHMVWRLRDTRLVMTTFLRYERERTASVIWAALGNVHRGGAPHLLELAATAPRNSNPGP